MADHEDGSRSVLVSSTDGLIGASLTSKASPPPNWQVEDTFPKRGAITLGVTAIFDFARESVPDLIRHLQNRSARGRRAGLPNGAVQLEAKTPPRTPVGVCHGTEAGTEPPRSGPAVQPFEDSRAR